jgi:hypothetical protein
VSLALKPTHAPVRAYYLALAQLANVGASHESAVREAWHALIEHCAGLLKWTLVREYAITRRDAAPRRLDGALLDEYRLVHGCLEAKDDADDLAVEMRAKLKLGYPAKNTLFWQPRRAILVQDGQVDQRVFQEAGESRTLHRPALHALQLLPHPPDLALHSGDGCGRRGPCLGAYRGHRSFGRTTGECGVN